MKVELDKIIKLFNSEPPETHYPAYYIGLLQTYFKNDDESKHYCVNREKAVNAIINYANDHPEINFGAGAGICIKILYELDEE